ncbi:MAG TPA: hypothetical protein ENJ90_06235, partial [Devosia sp.]|nr:hypothetical protein [Devosia sp.]
MLTETWTLWNFVRLCGVYRHEGEIQHSGDDYLDIDPRPDSWALDISIYPAFQRAFLFRGDSTEIQDSTHMMIFGRSRRIIGEEVGGALDLVPASADIKISSGDAILPPGIAGEGVMPTPGSKVGGAVPAPGN